jgi:hypothetical protein
MSELARKILDHVYGVLPGGVVHSNSGTTIEVSSNGTSMVGAKELEKVLFKRYREMSESGPTPKK